MCAHMADTVIHIKGSWEWKFHLQYTVNIKTLVCIMNSNIFTTNHLIQKKNIYIYINKQPAHYSHSYFQFYFH